MRLPNILWQQVTPEYELCPYEAVAAKRGLTASKVRTVAAVLNRGHQVLNSTRDAAVSAFGIQWVAEIAYFVGCYKRWSAELIGKGIRVDNFSPGVTDTPMLDSEHGTHEESDARRAMYIKMTPIGRLGQPEEMAASIFLLASAVTMQLDRSCWLDLFAQGLRRSALTDPVRICSRLTSRLAQKSASQPLPSQLHGYGSDASRFTTGIDLAADGGLSEF